MKLSLNQKRIIALSTAVGGVLIAFNVFDTQKATAITTLIAAVAAIYMPQDNTQP